MASDQSFADYAADQIRGAGSIRTLKMFGEYGIYCDERVVALVCDNQLFVRPTAGGRAFIGTPAEAPPYPGAKPHFLVTDRLDDREWLTELIAVTVKEVPLPKPKKPKPAAGSKRAGGPAQSRPAKAGRAAKPARGAKQPKTMKSSAVTKRSKPAKPAATSRRPKAAKPARRGLRSK